MSRIPVTESVSDHRGDFACIAAWLLDCLDSVLPLPGGHLVLYLYYHSSDRSFFSSPQRDTDLARALLDSYKQELEWDGIGFGDLRFDLRECSGQSPLSLILRPYGCAEKVDAKGLAQTEGSKKPTLVEFHWNETESQGLSGTVSLLRRWVEPLSKNTVLRASLNIKSNDDIAIARHIDVWQSHMRGPHSTVYLPGGHTYVSIGGSPGCDVHAPRLTAPLIVEYNSDTNEWHWSAPTAPWLPSGGKAGDLFLEYETEDGNAPVVLRGQSLSQKRSLEEIAAENRLPRFLVEIVGCLLPTPSDKGGYGVVTGSEPILGSLASSATELPEGAWLYLNRDSSAPYLLRAGEPSPGRPLTPHGVPHDLRLKIGSGPRRMGKWIEFSDTLLPLFHGELRLMPPISSRLVPDATSGDLPDEIFTEYVDSTLGRAPVRLESEDGRTYSLSFKPSAKHPVFVFSEKHLEVRRYDPSPSSAINLGTDADFILGATHYRLKQLAEPAGDDIFASSLTLPTRGEP